MDNDFWKEIKHFKYQEFSAPEDPESGLRMSPWAVRYLDQLRDLIGHPIIIHAGFAFSGHCEDSYHYKGEAIDFHIEWNIPLWFQGKFIFGFGHFGGIGIYPEWKNPGFHLDIRSGFQIWVKRGGQYVYMF